MGRARRMYANGIYHVAGHGSDDRSLFLDDLDRHFFLGHLSETAALLGVRVVSFMLMSNPITFCSTLPTAESQPPSSAYTAGTRATTTSATAEPPTSSAPTRSLVGSRTTTTSNGQTATSPATPSKRDSSPTRSTGSRAAPTPTSDSHDRPFRFTKHRSVAPTRVTRTGASTITPTC